MSATKTISLTPEAAALLAQIRDTAGVVAALAGALDNQNVLTVAHIHRAYLSFPKHGQPVAMGLRAVSTPGYRGTLHASQTVVSGNGLESGIGSPINKAGFSYPALHEFGGSFTKTSKPGAVRLRTDKDGELLRQGADARLAVFAKNTEKRAKTVTFAGGRKFTVEVPARAPVQHGIVDRLVNYGEALSGAVVATWSKESKT